MTLGNSGWEHRERSILLNNTVVLQNRFLTSLITLLQILQQSNVRNDVVNPTLVLLVFLLLLPSFLRSLSFLKARTYYSYNPQLQVDQMD